MRLNDITATFTNIKRAFEKLVADIADDTSWDAKNINTISEPKTDVQNIGFRIAQPITAYEIRRKEVADSSEPIEGILYIYNGQIIPDFYSECLFSDDDRTRRKAMYHRNFYLFYMRTKYDNMAYDEHSLPRGRIMGTGKRPHIAIDHCYFQNLHIIDQIIKLYRLPENIEIASHPNYRCPVCIHVQPERFFTNANKLRDMQRLAK